MSTIYEVKGWQQAPFVVASHNDLGQQFPTHSAFGMVHGRSNRRIAYFSKRLRESLEYIEQGRIPTFNLTETAILIENYIEAKKVAEHLFRTVAKIANIVVVE